MQEVRFVQWGYLQEVYPPLWLLMYPQCSIPNPSSVWGLVHQYITVLFRTPYFTQPFIQAPYNSHNPHWHSINLWVLVLNTICCCIFQRLIWLCSGKPYLSYSCPIQEYAWYLPIDIFWHAHRLLKIVPWVISLESSIFPLMMCNVI